MYYYVCPYCLPCASARLTEDTLGILRCKYEKEKDCEEKHKCKNVMQCQKCEEVFSITKDFLKEQKRKVKDG